MKQIKLELDLPIFYYFYSKKRQNELKPCIGP